MTGTGSGFANHGHDDAERQLFSPARISWACRKATARNRTARRPWGKLNAGSQLGLVELKDLVEGDNDGVIMERERGLYDLLSHLRR